MRKVVNKLIRMPAELVRSQKGVSILAIVFVMLVLSAIGYSMARMMASKQKSVPVTVQSSTAFHVAEGGLNWAGKYMSDLVSWSSLPDKTKSLGDGSFTVDFDPNGNTYCAPPDCPEGSTLYCITVKSTGTYGDGQRVLLSRFCREEGYGCNP